MTPTRRGPLDLLALTPLQRRVIVHLTREGPADVGALARALSQDLTEIQQTLAELAKIGSIHLSGDGQAEINLGRTRRRTLPARLWPALLATHRLYSTQEIATLRTAVPILQLARAKMGEFADHGPGHVLRVKSFATQLGYILGLTSTEQHLLRAAALFHDVGNIVERDRHHLISQETVENLAATGKLPFSSSETALVGLLCRWHRKEYDPHRRDELHGQMIRTGLMASILRVADAMDIDQRRSDYNSQFTQVLRFFFPEQLPFWTSLEEILGVRIRCTPAVNLQVLIRGQHQNNMQIAMLRQDLAGTPLGWSVEEIAVEEEPPPLPQPSLLTGWGPAGVGDETKANLSAFEPGGSRGKLALLAFPFDPHSLIMAALSRKHLLVAGYAVELLCYPDTADASAWLWGEALAGSSPANFARLVVINDRPDSTLDPQVLATIERWQAIGAVVSLLNRHETNWSRLPDLLKQGVEVILGGDWAYFWGDPIGQADLAWGRITALCTRDPTQSTVGMTAEEQAVTQGLLKVVYDAANQPSHDDTDWAALARPILDRIACNERAYFADQADNFATIYATTVGPGQVEGLVLRFAESALGEFPPTYYWALEAAIERQGRRWERGICFNIPYAIATWSTGEAVELLAINHWRDERAIPIRLLYPTGLGPPPEGNESMIQVRLPVAQAEVIVRALMEACNQTEL